MDKLAVILSLAALAVAGFAVFGGTTDTNDTEMAHDDGIDARLSAIETDLTAIKDAIGAESIAVAGPGADASADAGLAGRPTTVPSRVAELEKELASMKDRMASVEEKSSADDSMSSAMKNVRRWTNNRFFMTPDQAAQALDLDDRQKEQLGRIVDSSRDRLEELFTTPNDDGMTWKEAGKIELKGSGEGSIISLMGNRKKLEEFKKTRVPGTNETYGEAQQRIKNQGKSDARDIMTNEQQDKWDKANTDHMFGGSGGGPVSIAFSEAVVGPSPGK